MSYDLYVWKGPLVEDTEAATALIGAEDESGFEPSPQVQDFYDELRRRWPAESSPTALRDGAETSWGVTTEPSDRLVAMYFTWSVPGDVVEEVVELAQERDLVLYDPQGPEFYSPASLVPPEPERRDLGVLWWAVRGTLIGAAVVVGGWFLPVPILDWILIVVGGFLFLMGALSVVHWFLE